MKCIFILAFLFGGQAQAQEPVTAPLGKTTFRILLQFWAVNDTTAAGDANFNFRARRAEVKLNGSVAENTKWFLMFDPAKNASAIAATNDNKILQDLGIVYNLTPELEFVVGQMKIPTTVEGVTSSGELILPERSYIGRTFGDRRETGVMLHYTLKPLIIRVIASNGQVTPGAAATNVDDTNNSKDLHARVDYGLGENWKFGIFTSSTNSTAGYGTRTGGNVGYSLERFMIRAEGLQIRELDTDKDGISIESTYQLTDSLQAAIRYDNFQQKTAPENSANAYTIGLNHYTSAHNSKIQLAYTALQNMEGNKGSYRPATNKNGGLVILNFQTAM